MAVLGEGYIRLGSIAKNDDCELSESQKITGSNPSIVGNDLTGVEFWAMTRQQTSRLECEPPHYRSGIIIDMLSNLLLVL